jgi:hypothetical protein
MSSTGHLSDAIPHGLHPGCDGLPTVKARAAACVKLIVPAASVTTAASYRQARVVCTYSPSPVEGSPLPGTAMKRSPVGSKHVSPYYTIRPRRCCVTFATKTSYVGFCRRTLGSAQGLGEGLCQLRRRVAFPRLDRHWRQGSLHLTLPLLGEG